MSGRLARAGAIFLAPAPPASAATAAADEAGWTGVHAPSPELAKVLTPPVYLAGALASPADLLPVAGAVAADLRRRSGARTAIVCARGSAGPARTARPAAGALARRLAARDIAAVAAGALCRVALPEDPDAAVRETRRVAAAAAGTPVVLALSARTEALDVLLAEVDRLVLAPGRDWSPVYTALAAASLAGLGPPADIVRPPAGLPGRRAAGLGFAAAARPHATPEAVPA